MKRIGAWSWIVVVALWASTAGGANAGTTTNCDDADNAALAVARSASSARSSLNGAQIRAEVKKACDKSVHADSLIAVLKMMLAGEAAGTKRLDRPIPVGMPTGLMLAQRGVLTFDASAAVSEGLVSLHIEGPGMRAIVLTPLPSSGSIEVPVSSLVSGRDYRWTLATRQTSYTAQFSIADDAVRGEVADRLAEIARLPVDDTTRMVLQAAVYDDADLDSARDRLIRDIRRRTGP